MTSAYPKGLQPEHEWTTTLGAEEGQATYQTGGYLSQNSGQMSVASDGSIYISYNQSKDLTGSGYGTPSGYEPYLAKYNSDGSKAWQLSENDPGSWDFLQEDYYWRPYRTTTGKDGSIFIAHPVTEQVTGGGYSTPISTYDVTRGLRVVKYSPEAGSDWLGRSLPITFDWDVGIDGVTNEITGLGYNYTYFTGVPSATGITYSSDDSIYITGYGSGSIDNQASIGNQDVFISKISSSGQKQWTRQIGSELYDLPTSIATDSQGSVYIGGRTMGHFDGEDNPSVSGTGYGSPSGFVSKFKPDGTKEWSKVLGSSEKDWIDSIAIDSNDSLYISGRTDATLEGGSTTGYYIAPSQPFVSKYSSDGVREWSELPSEFGNGANQITQDIDGSILIAGITNQGNGYGTPVVSKINDDGKIEWSQTFDSGETAINNISVGNNGAIYISGSKPNDQIGGFGSVFLSKYVYKVPDYKVTTTHWSDNSQTSIDEGEWITTTVSTENVNQGTELYWEVEGVQGDITLSDFSQGELKGFSPIYGTFADGGFSISHLIAEDLTTEGLESMVVKLFSDQARNELLAQSSTVEINDSSKTPPPSTPDLIATSDSGISNSDNLTNDNTPTFSGTAEAGSSVELFADGISLGSSITDSNSNWAYTVANDFPLADGSIAITATTTTETATSSSDPSDPLNLTIDATSPAFSSGDTATPIEENSGAAQVIYTAAADDASAVSYSLKQDNNDDAASFSIDASTGKVSLKDDPDYETKTSYSFSISATDLAGNSIEQDVNLEIKDIYGSYILSTSSDSLNEGESLTTTITTTDVDPGTTLHWQLSGNNITANDLDAGELEGTAEIDSQGQASFSHTLAADRNTEGDEDLQVKLFTDATRSKQVGETASVAITDISLDPTYTLSTTASQVDEGQVLTSTISTTEVDPGTTLYWQLSGNNITANDLNVGELEGSTQVDSQGQASFSHTLAEDRTTEGNENLQLRVYTDSARSSQVGNTASVAINDTSLDPTYTLSTSASQINEGQVLTSTITTTEVDPGTTLYWQLSGNNITANDLDAGELEGTAEIDSQGQARFSHTLAADSTTEGNELLQIKLFSDSNRSLLVANTADIQINDTSQKPDIALDEVYNYEIVTRSGNSIESIEKITENAQIEITEGDSFRIRLSKEGSDAFNFGGRTYWHILSNDNYGSVWNDEAINYAPWSMWKDGESTNISDGLYLQGQDRLKSELGDTSLIDGFPEGVPMSKIKMYHPLHTEYEITTFDDATFIGDVELEVYLSLDKEEILLNDTHGHSFSGGEYHGQTFEVSETLTSKSLKILIRENDEPGQDLLITGPSRIPGDERGDIAVLENKTFVYDFDADSPASWSISGDDSDRLDIEAETGILSFIEPGNFLRSNDRSGDNVFELDVKATLENGSASVQSIAISIKDDPTDNFAPAIDFGPEDIVIRLSKGNAWNTLLSGDSRFSIWVGDHGAGVDKVSGHLQLRDRFTGALTLITATNEGTPSTGSRQLIDLSSDGRYALLTCEEYGRVDLDGLPGPYEEQDLGGTSNKEGPALYRKDLKTGEIIRVDTLSDGSKVNSGWRIGDATMSADGRYVAFAFEGLTAPERGSDDWSRALVYRKDLLTGELLTASSQSDGTPGEGWANSGFHGIGISNDGSKVSFFYRGNDLVEGTNLDQSNKTYLKDFNTGNIYLTSSNSEGEQLEGEHYFQGEQLTISASLNQVSPDGTKVIFASNVNSNYSQLYMKDVFTEDLILLSQNASGEEGNGSSGEWGAVFSDDGKYIAYESSASNLAGFDPDWEEPVDGESLSGMEQDKYIDKNNKHDIFIYELSTGITKRLLNDIANNFTAHIRNPNISSDGKYVSFSSDASGILPDGQGSEVYLALNPHLPTYELTTSKSSIEEGQTLTTNVSTRFVEPGAELHWSISGTGINQGDFAEGALTGSGQTDADGKFSFSHTLRNDQTREGPENLEIKLFNDALRSEQVGNTASVEIKDTSMSTHYVGRGDSAYVVVDGPSWQEAEAYAQSIGGNLVTINDEAENEWLLNAFKDEPSNSLHIGLKENSNDDDHEWASGETSIYRNWEAGEPNGLNDGNADQTAEFYLNSGRWNDHPNVETKGIAEISLARSNPNIAQSWQQPHVKQWTRLLGTTEHDGGTGLTTDSDGSIYITGFTDSNHPFRASGNSFFSKFDANGQINWTKLINASNATSIAKSSDEMIYVTGEIHEHPGSTFSEPFLSKYDNDGIKSWNEVLSGQFTVKSTGVAINHDSSTYITGYTYGDLDGNERGFMHDAFLTKYDIYGNREWTELLDSNDDKSYSVATSNDGSIYITGSTNGGYPEGYPINDNHGTHGFTDLEINSGGHDAFLSKFDTDGNRKWTKLFGTSGNDVGNAITTASDGSVYIAGSTQGDLDGQLNSGERDAFLTKYDADGNKQWTQLSGTSGSDSAKALTIGSDGSIYIAGSTQVDIDEQTDSSESDAFLTKYDQHGNQKWAKVFGTIGSDSANALTTFSDGSIYIAGTTEGNLNGQINSGGTDAFLAKFIPHSSSPPLDSDLELGYSLHSINGNDTQTDLKQLAVLGDSVDWQDTYRLDITAKSLAEGYDLETADITINFDPYLFNEIKASDITIGGQLPIANAVRIDNDVGTIRIAAASLGDLEAGDLYGNHLADAGSRIGADGAVVASIELDFNEFRLDTLTQNSNGKILDPSTPLFFGLSANQDETVFSKALDDGSGWANREIKSLRDLGGDLAVDGTKVTLYEAAINLEEQGDGLILSTERVIGSYNPISTNLVRSGDTISTTSTWTNVGNIEAQNIQVTGITNSNAELVESESYFEYKGIAANGDQVNRNSLNSGSFSSTTGEFDSAAQESGELHAAIKITGAAGNVVDLGLGIASLQADGSDLFSNQKGSKNLITYQGDLNYDGRVSMKDLAYLNAGAARQQQASEHPDEVDANNDGVVDASVATAVDANFDGQISMADLAVLDADWGQSLHQQPINGANGTQSSFTGSDQISWDELDNQGTTGDAAWDNQAFKDQNAVEASNDFVESLESPAAVGVIGMNGNSINNDVPEGGKGDPQDESLTV
ncbi:SBBP repeat-containing protein [Prochlorococcus marinus]|uniref:SBBP repeat-containing protein n=1 Tax=Prochlorococcus marinus TaxID=1219 RepID=UPI0007BB0D88|nr:SBBP repeat-containing protein [Prochlorococcus marinus]KZR83591.1 Beta-propeller repeat [Prochlorococcus marinus str. MIT 1327]